MTKFSIFPGYPLKVQGQPYDLRRELPGILARVTLARLELGTLPKVT